MAYGIAVDAAGNAYITGAGSGEFPLVNPLPESPAPPSGGDVFITKLNATGSALIYSTLLGGTGTGESWNAFDQGEDIAVRDSTRHWQSRGRGRSRQRSGLGGSVSAAARSTVLWRGPKVTSVSVEQEVASSMYGGEYRVYISSAYGRITIRDHGFKPEAIRETKKPKAGSAESFRTRTIPVLELASYVQAPVP